jgi:hypothetical protein
MILVGRYDSPYVRRVGISLHLLAMSFRRSHHCTPMQAERLGRSCDRPCDGPLRAAENLDFVLGGDIWVSTRESTLDPWSIPVNLGRTVNYPGYITGAPALSSDGTTLYC